MGANDALEDNSDHEKKQSKKAPIAPPKRKSKEQTKPKGKNKVGKTSNCHHTCVGQKSKP